MLYDPRMQCAVPVDQKVLVDGLHTLLDCPGRE